jgi:peptidoglycan hydrolase-like protein with peptidoglycan-binding domain
MSERGAVRGTGGRAGYGNYQWLSPGSRTLRLNDAGDDVKFLQRHLGVEADGYFGPDTAQALAQFRQVCGIDAGPDEALVAPRVVAGRDVWSALLGTRSALPRTRRRWRIGGDARLIRR